MKGHGSQLVLQCCFTKSDFTFVCLLSPYRDHFYQYGEIEDINVISKQSCAFITYTTRPAAEKAVEQTFNKLIIKGKYHNYLFLFDWLVVSDRLPLHCTKHININRSSSKGPVG